MCENVTECGLLWLRGLLLLFSQAGTHPLKRMDKELAALCTENMSLGQSILFLWSIYPFSELTGDASSFFFVGTINFCGSSDKYFSALLQEGLYSGITCL